eukprot:scaffold1353_cov161-Amphora_coffeaeformis.AAC.8
MSWLHQEEAEDRSRRWKELRTGSSLLCEKCQEKVSKKEQAIACRMAPSYILDEEDYHPSGCLNLLCRDCASSNKVHHTFHPCQCFTLGDHENILWCETCSKDFPKCHACCGLLCRYCQVGDTEDYGLLCQQCTWALTQLSGDIPKEVGVVCPPWPRYVIPEPIKAAVQKLHDKVQKKRKVREDSIGVDDETKPPAPKVPAKSGVPYTKPKQCMFVLLHEEGGLYHPTDTGVIGVYSDKTLAISAAKIKFESLSNGSYQDGRWNRPHIFEEVYDYTLERMSSGESGTLLREEGKEGGWSEISLHKTFLYEGCL